ncbi:hypothetical protein B0H10DRAFT_2126487 [Mycena sp. CBHHK59/15]|nr:hypothetical protein B0H10DRAFT_2126487 [Mycena sp. CBHHK59/15]
MEPGFLREQSDAGLKTSIKHGSLVQHLKLLTMADPVSSPLDSTMPDSRLDAPLLVLRAPRTAEEEGPSETDILDSEEYLVFPRSPSPVRTEPWDEEPDDLEYIPESGETLPPRSSSRSMKNQTMRSFEAWTASDKKAADTPGKKAAATSSPSKKSAASSSAALTCSLSSLSTSEPAPSDSELHKLANLAAPHKETGGEHRVRSDENDRRLIVWLLMLQKLIEENEKSQSLRIPKPEHLLRHCCLKQLMAEGRDSI